MLASIFIRNKFQRAKVKMPGNKYINCRLLKTNLIEAKSFDQKTPPFIKFSEFPCAKQSLIGMIEADVPLHPNGVMGIQIVPDNHTSEGFSYFNLLTDTEISLYKGKRVKLLFVFNIPSHYQSIKILFTPGDNHLDEVAQIETVRDKKRIYINPSYNFENPPSDQPKPTPTYAFVGGPPKSGCTWVEKILATHPDVFCNGEGGFFLNDVQASFNSYNFWFPEELSLNEKSNLCNAAIVDYLFRFFHKTWPVDVIADRSPSYTYSGQQALEAFPHARYVHCSRHPLDVAVSRLYHQANLLKSGSGASEHIMFTDEENKWVLEYTANASAFKKGTLFASHWDLLRKIIDEWHKAENTYEDINKSYPGQAIAVRYEHFINDFENEAARLFSFLNVNATPDLMVKIKDATDFKILSGGRKKGEESQTSFFRKGISADYLNHFTDSQIKAAMDYVGSIKNWSAK